MKYNLRKIAAGTWKNRKGHLVFWYEIKKQIVKNHALTLFE